jgi:hypothetical protein
LQVRFTGFLKYLLGVRKGVCNDALMSELCMFPLQLYWFRSCARFWCHFKEAKSSVLDAVAASEICLSTTYSKSWVAQFNAGLADIGASQWCITTNNVSGCAVKDVDDKWKSWYASRWQNIGVNFSDAEVDKRMHVVYKAHFKQANDTSWCNLPWYLKCGSQVSFPVVKSVARFRLSSHNLEVQRGRFSRVAYADRTCRRCGGDAVEVDDETHVVFNCSSSLPLRTEARFQRVFDALGDQTTLRAFMSHSDQKTVALYIHLCMKAVDLVGVGSGALPQAEQPPG